MRGERMDDFSLQPEYNEGSVSLEPIIIIRLLAYARWRTIVVLWETTE